MGQGYHSRSPEEFREYIENLHKKNRSHFLKQIIILIDLVLILVIFYMVHQMIAPTNSGITGKSSLENIQGIQITISSTQTKREPGALFFLLLENKTSQSISLKEWKLLYRWKTLSESICEENFLWIQNFPTMLASNTTSLLEVFVPPPQEKENVPNECKKAYLSKKSIFMGSPWKQKLLFEIEFRIPERPPQSLTLPYNPYKY